jgi:hypothetical protein
MSFFVLAAAATLIAQPAAADRECFENSCRLPAAVEPPPAPRPAPAVEPDAAPEAHAVVPAAHAKAGPRTASPEPAVVAQAQPRHRDGAHAAPVQMSRVRPRGHRRSAEGYWPDGFYIGFRGAPVYAVAPDAKIITIAPND